MATTSDTTLPSYPSSPGHASWPVCIGTNVLGEVSGQSGNLMLAALSEAKDNSKPLHWHTWLRVANRQNSTCRYLSIYCPTCYLRKGFQFLAVFGLQIPSFILFARLRGPIVQVLLHLIDISILYKLQFSECHFPVLWAFTAAERAPEKEELSPTH